MSKKNILLAITNGMWLIHPEFAHASASLVQRVLSGEKIHSFDEDGNADEVAFKGCFMIAADGAVTYPNAAVSYGSRYNPFQDAQPGSTAVIGMSGPIMKYDNCGDPGTKTYSSLLEKAGRHPNIGSVIIVADSPGGTVDGTQDLANQVKNFKQTYNKPILTFVDGLMASAMYWVGSGSDEIIANNETATIGSIGTMLSFADVQPMWEKEGVKFHYITADASSDKNKDYMEARKGNYGLVKEKLNAINEIFLNSVKENRAGKLDLKKENVLTGKTYLAEDALSAGLIDCINTFEYAVSRVQALASGDTSAPESSITLKTETQNTDMKTIAILATHTALLAVCGASVKAGENSVDVELTDELSEKINAGLAASADHKTALDAATEKLTASDKKVSDLEAKVAEQKTALDTSEAKVRSLETAGATGAATDKEKEEISTEKKEDFRTTADDDLDRALKSING